MTASGRLMVTFVILLVPVSVLADFYRICPYCGAKGFWTPADWAAHQAYTCPGRQHGEAGGPAPQPAYPHTHRTADGNLTPDDDYVWTNEANKNDFSVRYAPHVHWRNGKLTPDDGYLWEHPNDNDDLSVIY